MQSCLADCQEKCRMTADTHVDIKRADIVTYLNQEAYVRIPVVNTNEALIIVPRATNSLKVIKVNLAALTLTTNPEWSMNNVNKELLIGDTDPPITSNEDYYYATEFTHHIEKLLYMDETSFIFQDSADDVHSVPRKSVKLWGRLITEVGQELCDDDKSCGMYTYINCNKVRRHETEAWCTVTNFSLPKNGIAMLTLKDEHGVTTQHEASQCETTDESHMFLVSILETNNREEMETSLDEVHLRDQGSLFVLFFEIAVLATSLFSAYTNVLRLFSAAVAFGKSPAVITGFASSFMAVASNAIRQLRGTDETSNAEAMRIDGEVTHDFDSELKSATHEADIVISNNIAWQTVVTTNDWWAKLKQSYESLNRVTKRV